MNKSKKHSKGKIAVIIIASFVAVVLLVFGAWTAYWSQRHLFDSKVDSITAYQYKNNENCYRFEIRGTVKNWYYDFKTYDNVTFVGHGAGGEMMYSKEISRSKPLTVSRKETEFLIILDVDKSTYNWGDGLKNYVYEWYYYLPEKGETRFALFMQDNKDVPVDWVEPQVVTDSLLDS